MKHIYLTVLSQKAVACQVEWIALCLGPPAVELTIPLNAAECLKASYTKKISTTDYTKKISILHDIKHDIITHYMKSCMISYSVYKKLTVYGLDRNPVLDVSGINVQNDGYRNGSRSYRELGQFKTP